MHFCKECGHALKEGAQFCPECGMQTASRTPKQQARTPQVSLVTKVKQATKQQKIIAIAVLALLVVLVGGYQVGAALTHSDRLIDRFETALQEQDAELLADLLVSSDDRLDITPEKLEGLLAMITDRPSSLPAYVSALRAQAEGDEDGQLFDSQTIFSLKKDGKTALIYDRYSIEIMAFYFNISTNMDDTEILFDNEVVAVSDNSDYVRELGPVLPGRYQVKASYQNEYALLENESSIELINPHDQDAFIEIPLYGDYVSIDAPYLEQASAIAFFINDRAVDIEVSEPFGPVATDGSLSVHAVLTFPWGDVETEASLIESQYVNLDALSPFTEEVEQVLIDTIHTFGAEYASVLEARDDSSALTVGTDAFIDGRIEESLEDLIRWDRFWTGEHIRTVIDLDSFALAYDPDNYAANLSASVVFNSARTNDEDELADLEKSEDVNDWIFEYLYDEAEDTWMINDYESIWFFSPDNTMEIER